MNREIDFRVWARGWKPPRYVDHKFFQSSYNIIFNNTMYITQQFTGLKDKNSKKVYEGDLINFTIRGVTHGPESENITAAEVWYSEEDLQFVFGKFKGKLHSGEEYTWWYSMADRIDPKSIEVVGNVFRNNLK